MENNLKRNKSNEKKIMKNEERKNDVRRKKRRRGSLLIPILCFVVGVLIGILCSIVFFNKDTTGETNNSKENLSVGVTEELLNEESFMVETPYVNLYYPKKWEKQISIKHNDDEIYLVEFYATVGDEKEVHIFDIAFGEKEGSNLGTINVEGKDEIAVNVVSYNFEPDEKWTDEENEEIYMMLEDINYLIGKLQMEEGFVSAY